MKKTIIDQLSYNLVQAQRNTELTMTMLNNMNNVIADLRGHIEMEEKLAQSQPMVGISSGCCSGECSCHNEEEEKIEGITIGYGAFGYLLNELDNLARMGAISSEFVGELHELGELQGLNEEECGLGEEKTIEEEVNEEEIDEEEISDEEAIASIMSNPLMAAIMNGLQMGNCPGAMKNIVNRQKEIVHNNQLTDLLKKVGMLNLTDEMSKPEPKKEVEGVNLQDMFGKIFGQDSNIQIIPVDMDNMPEELKRMLDRK